MYSVLCLESQNDSRNMHPELIVFVAVWLQDLDGLEVKELVNPIVRSLPQLTYFFAEFGQQQAWSHVCALPSSPSPPHKPPRHPSHRCLRSAVQCMMYGPVPPRPKKTGIVRSRNGCKGCRERRTKVGLVSKVWLCDSLISDIVR